MSGEVSILNVSAGDTKLSFDPKNPAEAARAARTVRDMIRRGFAILIEVGKDEKGPLYRRADDFDPETNEYIIAGTPEELEKDNALPPRAPRRGGKGKKTEKRVPAQATNSVVIARTAGG